MGRKRIWANLLHLGTNMWSDRLNTPEHPCKTIPKNVKDTYAFGRTDVMRFDDRVWEDLTAKSASIGMNMIVIDLGEGLEYPSHPELAIRGSWSPDRLKRELARLRGLGLEPIPKMNFSCCHDAWLGEYRKMTSTSIYYRVCADLIRDALRLFESPRFIHLGMDEEVVELNKAYDYAHGRQGELWWHDLNFLVGEVEKHGSRAIVWSDGNWYMDDFVARMPKSVVQSNWYYWKNVAEIEPKADLPRPKDEKRPRYAGQNPTVELRTFLELDRAGFDQLPSATNWNSRENMYQVAEYCTRRINPDRLLGFLFETWERTAAYKSCLDKHREFFEIVEPIIRKFG